MENFKLKSFKLLKDDGMYVEYNETDTDESMGTYIIKKTIESPKTVHNDLKKKVQSLAEIVATIRGYNDFKLVVNSREFKATESQKEKIDKTILNIKGKIQVTGFSITGEDEKRRVVIKFKFAEDNGQIKGGSTHPIFLSSSDFEYEQVLEETVEDVTEEIKKYIFEDKHADLSVFTKKIPAQDAA